jgi:hypothetical protein
MDIQSRYRLAADLILGAHLSIVAFIVGGLILTLVGRFAAWQWVRNPWFRLAHLIAIAVVVAQSWLGQTCPLTAWEMALRRRAGDGTYGESFIAHWLGELLYVEAPWWMFVAAYTAFGALVLGSWIWIRPRPFRSARRNRA